MNFAGFVAVLLVSLSPVDHAQSAGFLDGNWVNVDPNAPGITNIQVQGMAIRPFSGKRAWGSIPVTANANGVLHGEWSRGFSTVSFDVSPAPNGMLRLHDHRHYNDANGARPDNDSDNLFSRSDALAATPAAIPPPPPAALAPPPPAVPAAAPRSGPTLDETIAFIHNASAGQGPVSLHSVRSNNIVPGEVFSQTSLPASPCVVEIAHGRFHYNVELSGVDPRSVRILGWGEYSLDVFPMGGGATIDPEVYVVTLRQQAGAAKPELGDFEDRALAERVAKAWIHAIVLCHKDEAPSPF
jgi:hypothetical protein